MTINFDILKMFPLYFIISLTSIILIHEFGHLLTAYVFGYELHNLRLFLFYYDFSEKKFHLEKKFQCCLEFMPRCECDRDIILLVINIAAGAMGNILLFVACIFIRHPLALIIAISNLISGFGNLIPFDDSDGEKILHIWKVCREAEEQN